MPVSHFRLAGVAAPPYESGRFTGFDTLLGHTAAAAATFDSLGLKTCGLKPKTARLTSCPTSYRTPPQHNRSPNAPLHKISAVAGFFCGLLALAASTDGCPSAAQGLRARGEKCTFVCMWCTFGGARRSKSPKTMTICCWVRHASVNKPALLASRLTRALSFKNCGVS